MDIHGYPWMSMESMDSMECKDSMDSMDSVESMESMESMDSMDSMAWEVSKVVLSRDVFVDFLDTSRAKHLLWDQCLTSTPIKNEFKSRCFAREGSNKSKKHHARAPLWPKVWECCSKASILEFSLDQADGPDQADQDQNCWSDPPFHTRRGSG